MDQGYFFDKYFMKRGLDLIFNHHPEGSKGKEVLIWQYLRLNDENVEDYFLSELYFQKNYDGTFLLVHKYDDPNQNFRDKSGTVVSSVVSTGLDLDHALHSILHNEDARIREMSLCFFMLALRKFSRNLVSSFIKDIKSNQRKLAANRQQLAAEKQLYDRRRWWACVQATKNASWFTKNVWMTGSFNSQPYKVQAVCSRRFEILRKDQHRLIWKYAGEYYDKNQLAPVGWHFVDGVEESVKFAACEISLPTENRG